MQQLPCGCSRPTAVLPLALLLFALQPFAIMLLFHQWPGLVAWRGTSREPSAVRGNAVSGKAKRCPIIQQWLFTFGLESPTFLASA